MWRVEYYASGGAQPVAQWLDGLEANASEHVHDKIIGLQQHGLALLRTNMMKRIEGRGEDFYELRYGSYRVAVYNDTDRGCFVLLHGFKKKRRRETREIETAYSRLREFQLRGQRHD
jgi:phage-related protein